MLDLREVCVRIAVVDERIEKLGGLPNAFFAFIQAEVLFLFRHDIVERLVLMVQPVELRDTWRCLLVILTKLGLALPLLITASQEVIPFVNIFQRCIGCNDIYRHGYLPFVAVTLALTYVQRYGLPVGMASDFIVGFGLLRLEAHSHASV